MKFQTFAIVCCLLLPASAISAQPGGAAANSISGTWKGSIGRSETAREPINVELKLDGGSITGTITGPPEPGTIKAGTFDPASGALKLEVTIGGGRGVAVFDGTVVQGTATGRVMINNQPGTFIIVKAASAAAAGEKPPMPDAQALVRKSFDQVSGWVTKAADAVPADQYSYRPTESVRTFGQQIGHIADAFNYFCGRAAGRNVQWSDANGTGNLDKATLVKNLKESTDACNAAYASSSGTGQLMANVNHTNLHYGNIVTYMRMLGLVPPSS